MLLFRALAKNMAPMTNADESPTNRLTLFPIYLSLFIVSTLWQGCWVNAQRRKRKDCFQNEKFHSHIKYISAKITKKIRWSVHESETTFSPERDFDLPQSFNINSVSHVNTVKFEMSFVVATQFWMHVNMRTGICSITSARSIYSRFFLYVWNRWINLLCRFICEAESPGLEVVSAGQQILLRGF